MSSGDEWVTRMQWSLTTILEAELTKAINNPGTTVGGTLGPYLTTTFYMEPSGGFVISRADGVFRAANAEQVVPIVGEAWLKELLLATHRSHDFGARAVDFITGPALERAKAYLKSVGA